MAADSFGLRLRSRIRELGLTQSEVATRMGVQPTVISNYTRDKHIITERKAPELAKALEWTVPDLLDGIKRKRSGRKAAKVRNVNASRKVEKAAPTKRSNVAARRADAPVDVKTEKAPVKAEPIEVEASPNTAALIAQLANLLGTTPDKVMIQATF